MDSSPESCSVLSLPSSSPDRISRVLGYIVSTPSSSAFCEAFSADQRSFRADIEIVPAAPKPQELRNPELRARCMEYYHQRN